MEHILYWLWLTTKYGVTPSKIKVLLEYFKTVEEIYFSKILFPHKDAFC